MKAYIVENLILSNEIINIIIIIIINSKFANHSESILSSKNRQIFIFLILNQRKNRFKSPPRINLPTEINFSRLPRTKPSN